MDENHTVAQPVFTDNGHEEVFNDLNVKNVENVNINLSKEKLMNDCTIARESTVTDLGIAGINATENVGLAADATAQRGFNHADGTAQRMAIAELDAIGRVGEEVCDSSGDILRDIHNADNHLSGSVERMGLFNAGVTERNADKTQAEVERFGLSELEAIRGSEKYLFAGMSANAREILLKSCADTSSIKEQSASQFKDLLLQNAQSAKEAALAACQLGHQADKNTAAIQLEAFRHKEELARQIAECCCEQKALTIEKASETQQLMRDFDKERIKDERDKLREELIALRIRSTLPPPLVGSVPI